MSRYTTPDIGDHSIAYKGRRYWLIKLDGKSKFDWMDADDAEYVMYDRLYDAAIATITTNKDGTFTSSLVSHVELSYDYKTLEEIIQDIPKKSDEYHRACGG